MDSNNYIWTDGFARIGHPELRVCVIDRFLLPEALAFLKTMTAYMEKENIFIQNGETINYGYWLAKFQVSQEGFLDVWEYNQEGTEFIPGATLTLTYWYQQHDICQKANAQFLPPNPQQLVAISQGVLEGDPTGGARFISPSHMSGWWITTDRYDGNVGTLKVLHLHHVTAVRPDLVRYLALPYGHRFEQDNDQERVWYDATIMSDVNDTD
jgi:hypothetical protein